MKRFIIYSIFGASIGFDGPHAGLIPGIQTDNQDHALRYVRELNAMQTPCGHSTQEWRCWDSALKLEYGV